MTAALATEILTTLRKDITSFVTHLDPAAAVLREQAVLVLTGGPTADFNMAIVEASASDEAVLREFAERVRKANLPALFMLPSAIGGRLAGIARDAGLSEAGTAPLMLLEGANARLAGDTGGSFRIERVEDEAAMGHVADLCAAGFGLDRDWLVRTFAAPSLLDARGVQFWLAIRDGEPYSTVTTIHTGDAVGIWSMATAPERQRQGAARALLEARLQALGLEGSDRFYLLATPAGKPLYDAVGFRTVDDLAIWTSGQSEQFSHH